MVPSAKGVEPITPGARRSVFPSSRGAGFGLRSAISIATMTKRGEAV